VRSFAGSVTFSGPAPAKAHVKSSQEPIIVLIDAAAEARQMVRSSLGFNCRLLEASTAAEGPALIESWKPELVLRLTNRCT